MDHQKPLEKITSNKRYFRIIGNFMGKLEIEGDAFKLQKETDRRFKYKYNTSYIKVYLLILKNPSNAINLAFLFLNLRLLATILLYLLMSVLGVLKREILF